MQERQIKIYNTISKKCLLQNYILLTNISEIKGIASYVEYMCPEHGKQKIKISNLMNGKKCPQCNISTARERYAFTPEYIYNKIQELGGELLNKDDYINNSTSNLRILCSCCHKEVFTTSFKNYIQHNGQVCHNCSHVESNGERKVRYFLENKNIPFYQEYRFSDCRDKNPLPFDFYLPEHNTIIEVDGRQHFEETNVFTYSLQMVKKHDNIKNNYCVQKNIKLIRIPYTQNNYIDSILDKKLISHKDIV